MSNSTYKELERAAGYPPGNETGTIVFPLNVNVKKEKRTRRRNLERKQFRRHLEGGNLEEA